MAPSRAVASVLLLGRRFTAPSVFLRNLQTPATFRIPNRLMSSTGHQRVLVLGSGYVSEPVVEYLTRENDTHITLVSAVKSEAETLADKYQNTQAVILDVQQQQKDLEQLVKDNHLVISLLPYTLHPLVAEMCIRQKTNMVTASYKTPAMAQLHNSAVEAGITVMNEVGLDPGIDHFLAMECFDRVKAEGGKITSFVSWAGGLPAPECADNPLGYKFSWSPRGVLLNTLSQAKYLQDGQVVSIPAGGSLLESTRSMDLHPGFDLEGFPNRDSTIYSEPYGIQTAQTLLRGTLRYKGYSSACIGLQKVGLINTGNHPFLAPQAPTLTWRDMLCNLLDVMTDVSDEALKAAILDKVGGEEYRLQVMEKLGLLSSEPVDKQTTPLDTLSNYLAKKLAYGAGERDMVLLIHLIQIERSDGSRFEEKVSLLQYGDPQGYSAMAKTVGYPTAIASRMILNGAIQEKGMLVPFQKTVYQPILDRLKLENVQAQYSMEEL
ncbi:alpha-aminoadipic semialdehyde synthase, mitochondrial-like [Branchiostoma floridae]|uniref:Alpha-aminoadipic semialdehyde synthase, mitochondrial-like n=2 Tax=Branchiostoma floridae TaxID=7739 RepID=A0A9J7MQQ7_BRAFL|nr:alpha-aminoadipic semialdehyde synthase, mitochondrial-like [Branchiostoma floridae]